MTCSQIKLENLLNEQRNELSLATERGLYRELLEQTWLNADNPEPLRILKRTGNTNLLG